MAYAASATRTTLPSPAMSAERAESLVVDYREVFALCDRDFDGKLTSAQFGEAIRALGHCPTEAQLAALTKTVDRVYPGGLSFANFIKVLSTIVETKISRPSECAAAIVDGFRAFEDICRGKHDGTVSKKDLDFFLSRLGDRLPPEDVERFMRFVGHEESAFDAAVDYVSMTETLMTAARAARS